MPKKTIYHKFFLKISAINDYDSYYGYHFDFILENKIERSIFEDDVEKRDKICEVDLEKIFVKIKGYD